MVPTKEEILSERQVAVTTGLGGFNRHNLNQVSSSSFVLSETRVGENQAPYKNHSPPQAQGTLSANDGINLRDDDAILSVNVQPT